MQSIIIPVDFTERSRMALDYAAMLFASSPMRFVLLHAFSTATTKEFLISIDDIIEKDIRQKLEAEGERFRSMLKNDKSEIVYVCKNNDIISTIASACEIHASEMMIIGSDGESSWSDISYREEGMTLNIVKGLSIPCLIVPSGRTSGLPKNILFATMIDGIANSSEVEVLNYIAKVCESHLDILNVGTERSGVVKLKEKLRKTVNGYFGNVDFKIHTLIDVDPYLAIGSFSEEHHHDLICIMYRKHGLLESILKQSVAKKMLSKLDKPILALKHTT